MSGESERSIDVEALRKHEFPEIGEAIYMNAASAAPLPTRARRAMERHNDLRGAIHRLSPADFSEPLQKARRAAARLIGAHETEIALGGNTSFGINLAARGLPLEDGATILVSDREFPANVYPWMGRKDARLELFPTDGSGRPDEERLMERLDRGDVSIFALSAVQFANGHTADVERFGRFCRERGIFFVVDAIQAAGVVPLDVQTAKIDVLATGGHKWLCSPFGVGFAYVRRELQERLEPRAIGWTSMAACEDFSSLLDYRWEFVPDARRYETGTPPFQDMLGMAESIELLLEIGVERIHSHVQQVLEPLREWLRGRQDVRSDTDLASPRRSGIMAFRPPGAEAVFQRLEEAGVTCVLREGAIRLAPHLYNTREEMERVVRILEG